jgi:hypothetical protein
MNKYKNRKEKLYNIYSQNLSWVKQHPSISFEPDFEEGYICPLCLNLFNRNSLNELSDNPLTFDHNPPKSLGGKNGILTCKQCNSTSGHKLDYHLLTRLEEIDFHNFTPNSKARTIVSSDEFKITSDITIDDRGTLKINIDRKNSNPIHADKFFENRSYTYKAYDPFLEGHDFFEAGLSWQMNFEMQMPEKSNERFADIALLKIAYLYAFQKFGHGFLINPSLYKIREQILNPEKDILPKVFWIKYDFPKNAVGLNIISKPEELKCFLIVFNLSTKSSTKQFAIALPGTSKPHLEIYNNIESILCRNKEGFAHLHLEHLFDKEYATERKWAFASHHLWKKLACAESPVGSTTQ